MGQLPAPAEGFSLQPWLFLLFSPSTALWARSVIEYVAMSVCMYVCMSVIKVVIVDKSQSIRIIVILFKIEWVCMVLRISNLEEHQNCIICSKIMTSLTTLFVHHK